MTQSFPNIGSRPARIWAYHARRQTAGAPSAKQGRVGRDLVRWTAHGPHSKPAMILTDNDDKENSVCDGLKPECCARHKCLFRFFVRVCVITQSHAIHGGNLEKNVHNYVDYSVRTVPKHHMLWRCLNSCLFVGSRFAPNRTMHRSSTSNSSTAFVHSSTACPHPV